MPCKMGTIKNEEAVIKKCANPSDFSTISDDVKPSLGNVSYCM